MGTYRGVLKCGYCRKFKRKCERRGSWDENSEKQKCENCIRSNHPYSPGERTKRTKADGVSDQGDSMAREEIDMPDMPDTSDVKEVKQKLNHALKDLDVQKGVCKELHLTLNSHRERQRQLPTDDIYKNMPNLEELTRAQISTMSALLSSLAVAGQYTDTAARVGEKAEAERAYLRMRDVMKDVYQSLPANVANSYSKLLKKIAAFYMENNEPLRAEKYLLECSRLYNDSGLDEESWSSLALVLHESSRQLHMGLEMDSNRKIIVPRGQFAFPAFHRIFGHGCISAAPCLISRMELSPDITGSPPLHATIIGNSLSAAFSMIQNGTEEQLESRDMYSRTPMFLAALFMAESIGFALMNRYKSYSLEIRKRLVDARNYVGQTILATAIKQGCTFEFIEALIENCANVDPDPMPHILSPLQAAALQGREDVAILLLSHGAQDSNAIFGELRASELARCHGYMDIETLIITASSS